jgi:hypothetical protein
MRYNDASLRLCSSLALVLLVATGCGTTRVTDTQRTATEQLLVSNAVDQAVSQLDFRALAGKSVFFDPQYLDTSVDRGYLVSSLRQHLLACGCILQEDRNRATYVIEARTGGVGTDRNALLIGVPQMNVPAIVPGQPSTIPEIPLAKKTDQKGVAKIAVFAYNRVTGKPVWQSGIIQAASTANDTWLLGVGPIQRGTIRGGTEFAGSELGIPLMREEENTATPVVPVTQGASWWEPPHQASPARLVKEGSPLKAVTAASAPETKPAPAPAPALPLPSPAPNAGGQAETQPAKLWISGFATAPDS